uniref:Immunoglobulin V-set domain-containing protein n=1 Tax=Oncorhynchus mykiss TaxID=8022 RepID=A0A8C7S4M1_ONCMY
MLSKRTILLHLVNLQLYSTLNHHIYLYNVFLTLKRFVLKGENVRLHVQGYAKLNNIEDLKWTFNKSHTLVKYSNESSTVKVYTKYQGRIEFSEANFSLVLKNLQEGDSGLYDAGVSGEENKDVAKYQISVQERVVTPVLTVNSVSSINGNCNVTVTCRGQNTSVTSSCNSSTCSQVGGESRGAETSTVPLLSVYVAGGFIICNHSNQISWAPNMKEIETICASNSSKTRTHAWYGYGFDPLAFSLIIIHESLRIFRGHDSIHINVELFKSILLLCTTKVTPKSQYISYHSFLLGTK